MKRWRVVALVLLLLAGGGYAYWKYAIPKHRIEIQSELVMLGDLDGDHRWTAADLAKLDALAADPWTASDAQAWRLDLNGNGIVDSEDRRLLQALVASGGDPYSAEAAAASRGEPFPRPRELYRYVSLAEYLPRPRWALPYAGAADSVLTWLREWPVPRVDTYAAALNAAIYDEAVRFDGAWRRRVSGLAPEERAYADRKLARVDALRAGGDRYGMLLALMELVEDAETLTTRGQPAWPLKLLAFRDHLREVLASPQVARYQTGRDDWRPVMRGVAEYLREDLGLEYDLEHLGPPRNLTHLENYLLRSEWQYYKSSAREADFRALVTFAQHDPRYLRAVARTSRKLHDGPVENHNLPMVLLFREALRLEGGDKKRAVGLLDETIRIPFGWVKSIPRDSLPGSLALDNFLLPGNKEDGADKSRHWNVFGGICLYKSPQEALDLALKREMQDFRDGNYSADELREFFRDLIADLNGMYHVMTIDPGLLRR